MQMSLKQKIYENTVRKMSKIVVLGSSNTDLVIRSPRMPLPGETLLGGDFMMAAGGKGANQAVAISRLGSPVTFIAKVGRDMFGDRAVEQYAAEGIDTSTILRDEDAPSGVALITVDDAGENSIVVAGGANNKITVADVDSMRDRIESADYLLMQLEVPMPVVEYAAAIAFDAGVKVVLNPAPAAKLSDGLLSKCYMLTPNEKECGIIAGIRVENDEQAETAAELLIAKGVQNVVVTLGGKGSLYKSATERELIPAYRVKSVDTTAAGDTYNGALCVALSEGKTIREAAEFATKASAISVTRAGAQPSLPTRDEVEGFDVSKYADAL